MLRMFHIVSCIKMYELKLSIEFSILRILRRLRGKMEETPVFSLVLVLSVHLFHAYCAGMEF